jgi:spermidine synthase
MKRRGRGRQTKTNELSSAGPRNGALRLSTVFITGAAVMLIEILGTRIIGPVFGVSLFVWSALLAVTLAALAGGYYLGGVLADRTQSPALLSAMVVAAGLLLGTTPLTRHFLLSTVQALGPRLGPLLAAGLLFAPTLLALGTLGPIAVRLDAVDVKASGRRVGSVFAVSTLGSLAGTFLTAFALIPAFDVDQILSGTALLLIVTGAVPLALHRRPAALTLILVPVLARFVPDSPLPAGYQIVDRSQSLYGLVEVIDDFGRGVRLLRADHSIIGAEISSDHSGAFSFLHLLELVRFVRPDAKSLLQIGLGIGSLPMALAPHGIVADVVEIDPAVVRFAREHFGFATEGRIFVADARAFLSTIARKYDLVVHDTFTGGATPEHLLSIEVLQRIRDVLTSHGVLALNFVGGTTGPGAEASRLVARTLRAVFKNVRAFADGPADSQHEGISNIVFFASNGELDFQLPVNRRPESENTERVFRSFRSWEVLSEIAGAGPTISDDLNPLSRLELPIAEEHASAMNKLLPLEVWLH